MPEKTIIINKKWLNDEKYLMGTLAKIIRPNSDFIPFNKHEGGLGGYRYQLDCGNNWWAEVRENQLVIAYRYSEEILNALVSWVTKYFE